MFVRSLVKNSVMFCSVLCFWVFVILLIVRGVFMVVYIFDSFLNLFESLRFVDFLVFSFCLKLCLNV